jgi:hypothetical protein
MRADFTKEMRRFLPATVVRNTVETQAYWGYLGDLVEHLGAAALAAVR